MNQVSVYCFVCLVIFMKLFFANGTSNENKLKTGIIGKKEYGLNNLWQSFDERRKLAKRQIVLSVMPNNLNLQTVFGNMCGLMICCDATCCGGSGFDYYDYEYYGGIGGVITPTVWPFSFLGSPIIG